MAATDFLSGLGQALVDVFQPLQDAIATPHELGALLRQEGWQPPAIGDWYTPLSKALALAGDIENAVTALTAVIEGGTSENDIRKALDAGGKVLADLRGLTKPTGVSLPSPLDREAFWTTFPVDLVQDLVFRYVERAHPTIFAPLHLLGVLDEQIVIPDTGDHARLTYVKRTIRWERLAIAATNPSALPKDVYGWGGTLDHVNLLLRLERVLRAFGMPSGRNVPIEPLAKLYYPSAAPNGLRLLRATLLRAQQGQSFAEAGLVAVPIPPTGTTDAPSGIFVGPYIYGGAATTIAIDGPWSMRVSGGLETAGLVGIEIRPGKATARLDVQAATVDLALTLVAKPTNPWIIIGSEDGAHLACTELEAGIELTGSVDEPELKLRLHTDGLQVVFDPSGGDSFVTSVCGSTPTPAMASGDIIWSSASGLHVDGQNNLSVLIPLQVAIGPITIQSVHLAVTSTTNDVTLVAAASIGAAIGPVQVVVSDIGVTCSFTPVAAPARGTFGDLDAEFGFKSPSGAGLAIDVAGLTGGGFLSCDPAAGQYAGMLQLAYQQFQLQAFGLIATKLPTGPGYSLIAMIDANFPPIELVAGFTLNGVGGLFGVNRTISTDALKAALKAKTLSNFLFAKNPVANAAQILTDLDTFFPPAQGRYIFGPLLQIGWGGPAVTIDLALVLELPDPVRLVLIGELAVLLPEPDEVLVELHMDVLGTIDFGTDEGSLDAVLHDSHIMSYPLQGAMAFRGCWAGGDKTFLLSIGGFHPKFQPPPGFPTLQRLAISMPSGHISKLNLNGYLAVSSNTLQIGAHLDIFVGVDGFGISGYLNFDTLIERNPFHFDGDISGGVTLSADGHDIMSLDLSADLTGPAPWHCAGSVHFSVLGFGVTKSFAATFGDNAPALPTNLVDVGAAIRTALGDPRNYSATLTTNENGLVTLRIPTVSGAVLGHPGATLKIDQKICPLGLTIQKFGAGAPAGDALFTITAVTADGAAQAKTPITDEFAPAQFLNLSDDDELAAPSFEAFDSGVELGDGALSNGPILTRPIVYETLIVDTPGGTPREDAGYTPPIDRLFGIRTVLKDSGRLRYAMPAQPMVRAATLGYVIATTDQIAASGVGAASGQTFAQARAALAAAVAQNPGQRGALQIVAHYEVAA